MSDKITEYLRMENCFKLYEGLEEKYKLLLNKHNSLIEESEELKKNLALAMEAIDDLTCKLQYIKWPIKNDGEADRKIDVCIDVCEKTLAKLEGERDE